ncbi:MAG: thioesterase family protein [Cytophagales bacterium]
MFVNETQLRVRYAETDQMGYVYYGNYATYLEVARVESLRKIGVTYSELEHNGIMMPVLEYKTKYIRPAKYDQLLTIKTIIKELPKIRIVFEYEIYNEDNELLNKAETTLVFVDASTMKPIQTPETVTNQLKQYFN